MAINRETRRTVLWVFIIIILAVLSAIFLYPRYKEKQAKIAELNSRKAVLAQKEEERRQLSGEVEALQNDPETVGRVAREKFGMGKDGERVVIYK